MLEMFPPCTVWCSGNKINVNLGSSQHITATSRGYEDGWPCFKLPLFFNVLHGDMELNRAGEWVRNEENAGVRRREATWEAFPSTIVSSVNSCRGRTKKTVGLLHITCLSHSFSSLCSHVQDIHSGKCVHTPYSSFPSHTLLPLLFAPIRSRWG